MRRRSVLWVVIFLWLQHVGCPLSFSAPSRAIRKLPPIGQVWLRKTVMSPLPYKVILRRLANCSKMERLPRSRGYPADHASTSAEPCFPFSARPVRNSCFKRHTVGWLPKPCLCLRTEHAADVYVGGTCPIAGRGGAPRPGIFAKFTVSSRLPHHSPRRRVWTNGVSTRPIVAALHSSVIVY